MSQDFRFRFSPISFVLLTSEVMGKHAVTAVKQMTAYENITERKLDIDWGEEFLIGCEKLIHYRIENDLQNGFLALPACVFLES